MINIVRNYIPQVLYFLHSANLVGLLVEDLSDVYL